MHGKIRLYYGFGIGLSFFMLGVALYLQAHYQLMPCVLCEGQRFCILFLFLLNIVGFLLRPEKVRALIVMIVGFGLSALGFLLAGRQIFLQYFASASERSGMCIPGLGHLFNTIPALSYVDATLESAQGCGRILFTFLGLDLSVWTALFFLLLAIFLYRAYSLVLQHKLLR